MANVARRSFLKLIGVAPIAAPVAAQEAAAKMGLRSMLGAAGGLGGGRLVGYAQECAPATGSHLDYLKSRLTRLLDPSYAEDMRRDIRGSITHLDPDLASMRGISPSAAMSIQLDRIVKRNIEQETWSVRKQIKEWTGL
jgi:hypothetical protein